MIDQCPFVQQARLTWTSWLGCRRRRRGALARVFPRRRILSRAAIAQRWQAELADPSVAAYVATDGADRITGFAARQDRLADLCLSLLPWAFTPQGSNGRHPLPGEASSTPSRSWTLASYHREPDGPIRAELPMTGHVCGRLTSWRRWDSQRHKHSESWMA